MCVVCVWCVCCASVVCDVFLCGGVRVSACECGCGVDGGVPGGVVCSGKAND